jgi:hypothetical protein
MTVEGIGLRVDTGVAEQAVKLLPPQDSPRYPKVLFFEEYYAADLIFTGLYVTF